MHITLERAKRRGEERRTKAIRQVISSPPSFSLYCISKPLESMAFILQSVTPFFFVSCITYAASVSG